ncbi:Zn-ribbon domain-containing OB-fold protein [Arthrobacter sp. M4]|uniref:Zn-ribbon domain-containing OB-fold protein n=1 Tax=Arthrobacter sp. M4 TaxID=218160 RepID=UPI001CDC6C96|nr:Zn-ribbon domain-containing OB-fold protein [Arthrobacter sp. M4]MCA4135386.1 Zn-ribbon domain-containing OB-fold protein [Arthrobacter sp. M4]
MSHPVAVSWDKPFWESAAQGRLVAQQCRDCGRLQHYPRPACIDCLSQSRDWIRLSGRGTVWSFSIVRQVADPAFAGEVPFALVDVELEEGLRITSRLDDTSVEIGDRVQVTMRAIATGLCLPYFERLPDAL